METLWGGSGFYRFRTLPPAKAAASRFSANRSEELRASGETVAGRLFLAESYRWRCRSAVS